MDRRDLLKSITAGGSLAAVSTPASAGDFRRLAGGLSQSGAIEGTVQRDDWVPHHTVDIEEDGTTRLSISLEGENAPSTITLNKRRTTVQEVVEGQAALSTHGNTFSWDVDEAPSVAFRVQLGGGEGRGLQSRRFENAIASDVNELVQVTSWPEGPDTLPSAYRFTFDPPSGWSSVSPGERVAPDTYDLLPAVIQYGSTLTNLFAVGDFDVHERAAGETTIRFAQLPAADHPYPIEDALDLLVDTTPVVESTYGDWRPYPWAAIFVPSDFVRGGFIKDDSIFFGDDFPLVSDGGSTYPHELGGLYTRAITCTSTDCSRWYVLGGKSYVGRYALYATGRLDHDELLRMFHAWMTGSDDARDHEDPLGVPANDSPMTKGTALCAMLDMEIRSRTDGEQDIGNWLSEIADQRILQYRGEDRSLIRDEEARPLLYEITGVDYTEFYDRFVHGSEFPANFFAEHFSLKNPWPVYAAFEYPRVELPNGEIRVGESTEVTVEMRNDVDRPQQRTLHLVVDGNGVAANDVQLDPGAATTVTLEQTFTEAGDYELRVPPVERGTVAVTEPGSPSTAAAGNAESTTSADGDSNRTNSADGGSATTTSADGPGFGVVSALTGLTLGAVRLLSRRSGDD